MGDFEAGKVSAPSERKLTEVTPEKGDQKPQIDLLEVTQDSNPPTRPQYGGVAPIFFKGQEELQRAQRGQDGRLPPGGQVVPPVRPPIDSGPPINRPSGSPFNPPQDPAQPPGPGRTGDGQVQPNPNPNPNPAQPRGSDWLEDVRARQGQESFGSAGVGGLNSVGSGQGPLGDLTSVDAAGRDRVLKSLYLQHDVRLHMIEGAIGGYLGSGPIPWGMDRLTMTPFTYRKVGVGAGIGAGIGLLYGASFDKDHVVGDTLWGAGIGGSLTALTSVGPVRNYWRDNHSPLQMQIAAETNRKNPFLREIADAQTEIGRAQRVIGTAEEALAKDTPALERLVKDAETTWDGLTARERSGSLGKLQERRYNLLTDARNNPASITPETVNGVRLPSSAAPFSEGKFLRPDEAEMLLRRAENHTARVQHTGVLKAAEDTVKDAQTKVAAIERGVARLRTGEGAAFNFLGTSKNPAFQTAVKEDASLAARAIGNWRGNELRYKLGEGVAIASAGLAASYALDNLFGNDQRLNANPRFYMEGPATALALCAPTKWGMPARIGIVGAGVLGEGLVGSGLQHFGVDTKKLAEYGPVFQPNWVDAVGTSAAWMLPFSKESSRLKTVLGTYGVARVVALAANAQDVIRIPGIEQPSKNTRLFEGFQSMVDGNKEKLTDESFRKIVETGKTLGMENDGALHMTFTDFLDQHRRDANPLHKSYTGSAVATSMGEYWLERGVRYDQRAHNDASRLLAGRNLDLGGQALNYFYTADTELNSLQEYVKANNLSTEEIDKSRSYVQEKIKLVFGKHDVPAIIEELKMDYGRHIDFNGKKSNASHGLTKLEEAIGQQAKVFKDAINMDQLNTVDKSIKIHAGKVYRDLAIIDLAIAIHKAEKGDGDGGEVLFKQAGEYLDRAQKLEQSLGAKHKPNEDLPQLIDQAYKIGPVVAAAIRKQWTNDLNNPFGIKR